MSENMLPNGLPQLPGVDALTLRTSRLDLTPITKAFAPEMFQLLNNSALYKYVTVSPPADVIALASEYEVWQGRRSLDGSELWLNWALRQKENKQLIGHLQAGVLVDHAYVAWILGSRWQHLGYATEAAAAVVDFLLRLGVREIRASINPLHKESIRVAERIGLRGTNEVNDGELIWKRVYSSANDPRHDAG